MNTEKKIEKLEKKILRLKNKMPHETLEPGKWYVKEWIIDNDFDVFICGYITIMS